MSASLSLHGVCTCKLRGWGCRVLVVRWAAAVASTLLGLVIVPAAPGMLLAPNAMICPGGLWMGRWLMCMFHVWSFSTFTLTGPVPAGLLYLVTCHVASPTHVCCRLCGAVHWCRRHWFVHYCACTVMPRPLVAVADRGGLPQGLVPAARVLVRTLLGQQHHKVMCHGYRAYLLPGNHHTSDVHRFAHVASCDSCAARLLGQLFVPTDLLSAEGCQLAAGYSQGNNQQRQPATPGGPCWSWVR